MFNTEVILLHWLNLHKGTKCDTEFSISPFFISTYSTFPAPKKHPACGPKFGGSSLRINLCTN
jgi:hypothetical protein